MRNPTRSTRIPSRGQIVMTMAGGKMTITGILRTEGDIPGVINHHAVMERNLTSDHILLKGGGIILERTEEVLPVTEVISQDMTRRRVQEINTDHMDLTVTNKKRKERGGERGERG